MQANGDESLLLKKNKKKKFWDLLSFAAMIFLIVCFIVYLATRPELRPSFDAVTISLIALILGGIAATLYYHVRITYRNYTDYLLSKVDGKVLINDFLFCRANELDSVTIRRISGWKGVGASYTIGLASGRNFFPLSFNQGKDEANAIAAIIAQFFETEIVARDGRSWFPNFR